MTKGPSFMRGETAPYCPAATQIVLSVPSLSVLRLSGWLGVAPSTLARWAERAGINEKRQVVRSVKPCGYSCCAAAIRVVWSPDISKRMVGDWLCISGSTATRWAAEVGLDPRVNARPVKRISPKAIRTAWLDKTITTAEAARRVGLSPRALYERSIAMGLPSRRCGVPPKPWPQDFDAMWRAGVTVREMARACKRASPSHITIEAKRRGLPARKSGAKKNSLTLKGFAELRILESLRAQADREREHWKWVYLTDGLTEQRSAA